MEPALHAYAEKHKCKVLIPVFPGHEFFYRNHPHVITQKERMDDPDLRVDRFKAMHYASSVGLPVAAGYHFQLGLADAADLSSLGRLHYKSFFMESVERFTDSVIIVPYGYSCCSRDGTTGALTGRRPNIQPPLSIWDDIIKSIPTNYPIFVMCGTDTNWNWPHDFGPRVTVVRGLPIDETTVALRLCKCLISVDTGILHMTSGTKTPTVFLSCAMPPSYSSPRTTLELVRPRGSYADEFSVKDINAAIKRILE